jgi:YebC/PmpR family DNA-binding regulatory protein
MSGHSKWAKIKRSKGAADAKKGQLFTKLTREIIVAARQGGANVETNFRLRLAVQSARDSNMPNENVERAIKKGSGELEASALTELTFEGYGASGVAVLVKAVTDNRNRTSAEVRSMFSKHAGNLGESGCVSWLFDNRGVLTVDTGVANPDELALIAIDAGAEDFKIEKGFMEIYTTPQTLETVRKTVEIKSPVTSAEVSLIPKTTVNLDEKGTLQVLKLVDSLEDLDDVQSVFTNADFSDAILEKVRAQLQ